MTRRRRPRHVSDVRTERNELVGTVAVWSTDEVTWRARSPQRQVNVWPPIDDELADMLDADHALEQQQRTGIVAEVPAWAPHAGLMWLHAGRLRALALSGLDVIPASEHPVPGRTHAAVLTAEDDPLLTEGPIT